MRNLPVNLDGRRCECGALAEKRAPVCRKCRSRARRLRRKPDISRMHTHESAERR